VLRANPLIVGANRLNIEGAASSDQHLWLLPRGNISNIHAVIEFERQAFLNYLDSNDSAVPPYILSVFTLPQVQTRTAGFSAAANLGDGILFAASVEDTDNEIDDGPTLGSFIGLLRENQLQWCIPVEENGKAAAVKIEGLTVTSAEDRTLSLYAVTDNDAGESEVLQIEMDGFEGTKKTSD
jgi:hypothetical protein